MNLIPQYYKKIENLLNASLPGEPAQYKMAPLERPSADIIPKQKTRYAGVLISLYQENQECRTILIRRPVYKGVHSGQISLPGGKYESHDKDLVDTALRETYEEIGIPPGQVDVIGSLTPLHIPVSNYVVYPVVGMLNSKPKFKRDPKEVQEIFAINIEALTNPEYLIEGESIRENERTIKAPYYLYNSLKIWGATAMILSEFIELHKQAMLTS